LRSTHPERAVADLAHRNPRIGVRGAVQHRGNVCVGLECFDGSRFFHKQFSVVAFIAPKGFLPRLYYKVNGALKIILAGLHCL
jgi:hypothetical protein